MKSNTVCLTGHRPKSLPWGYDETEQTCIIFKEKLKKVLIGAIEYGFEIFLTGMAEGFDMIATELLIELRKKYKQIKIIAVIPCLGQEAKWREEQQKRYKKIINMCDKEIILSKHYTPTCMNERNKYMVDHSSVCIACWNGKPSGTGNTVYYAMQNGCRVRIIKPFNKE